MAQSGSTFFVPKLLQNVGFLAETEIFFSRCNLCTTGDDSCGVAHLNLGPAARILLLLPYGQPSKAVQETASSKFSNHLLVPRST